MLIRYEGNKNKNSRWSGKPLLITDAQNNLAVSNLQLHTRLMYEIFLHLKKKKLFKETLHPARHTPFLEKVWNFKTNPTGQHC